jgi:hypothetical protein
MYRMVAAENKIKNRSAISGSESIVNVEKDSVLTIQNRWREILNQRRIDEQRIINERIILENSAATAIVSESLIIRTAIICFAFILLLIIISVLLVHTLPLLLLQQSCFRGYRDYVKYALQTYAAVQIQACVRRFISICLVERLKECATLRAETIFIAEKEGALTIQNRWRQSLNRRRIEKQRLKLSAISESESIINVEKKSVLTIQNRWRETLNQRRIDEQKIINERIILENSAATAIVSESLIIRTAIICFAFTLLLIIISVVLVRALHLLLLLAIMLPWLSRLCKICLTNLCRGANPSLCEKIHLHMSCRETKEVCHAMDGDHRNGGKRRRVNHTESMETKP